LEQGYQPTSTPPRQVSRTAPARQPSRTAPVKDHGRESEEEWWGFLGAAKWKFLAAAIGIVLVCLIHLFHPLLPVLLGRRMLLLPLLVPLFFGAAFGPWVGLAVGLGGLVVGNLFFEDGLRIALFGAVFYPRHPALYFWWIPVLLYSLAGFVPGLTMLGKRKYPSISSVTRAILLALILFAATLGFLLYSVGELRFFPAVGLVMLVNLAIALVLLIVYSVIVRLIDPA
jgi:hypothetical protein